MAPPPVLDEHEFMALARKSLDNLDTFFQAHPLRTAGSPGCLQAAHDLATEFGNGCDTTHEEKEALRLGALWATGKVVAVCALLGAALSVFLAPLYTPPWTLLVYAGTLFGLIGLAYAVVVYVFFSAALDWLFPHRDGYNVVGELTPQGPATRQVLLVGHHDAPYVFSFLERFTSLANVRFFLAMLGYLWILGYGAFLSFELATGAFQAPHGAWIWGTIAALLCAAQLFFMITGTPSPGAGDNLSSSFMALTLARYFRAQRAAGNALKRTRLLVLSTDAEEAGERGSKAYVRRHHAELDPKTTFVLNMDTVAHSDDLAATTRDRNNTLALSKDMASDLCAVANRYGITLAARPFRFGAGATDAAPFAEAGIPVTSIIGSSMAIVARGHEYHTSRDTGRTINAAAVRDTLMIAAGYIRLVDEKQL